MAACGAQRIGPKPIFGKLDAQIEGVAVTFARLKRRAAL